TETTISGGCHSPGDSRYQELEVALDSSSATINQLNEKVESLKQQRKQVEHQLEEVTWKRKQTMEIHKAQTEQLGTINILVLEKADLKTTVYHTKRAATPFEGESKDLTSHLQYSLQRIGELEQTPSAVSMQQQEEDRRQPGVSQLLWVSWGHRGERALDAELGGHTAARGLDVLEQERLREWEERLWEQERLLQQERLSEQEERLLEQEGLREEGERLRKQE
ncbi:golgin subfamily A member 6A-like, partial [Theropithecus gelada]|uniref:golgin subfamily A member 6A-like n=1 Tax=Theropithecus gelada TaxID=9565 RepID=UPI000DC18493